MVIQILNQSINTISFSPQQVLSYEIDDDLNTEDYFLESTPSSTDTTPKPKQKRNTSKQSQHTCKRVTTKIFQPAIATFSPKPQETTTLFAIPANEKLYFLFVKDIVPEPPKNLA